jgi:hypothetical protein
MRFLRSVLGVSQRDKIRSEDVTKQTQNEWWKKYTNTRRNCVITQRGCLLNACRGKHTLIIILEDGTMGVQEGDGDNNSFSLGTGQRTQSLNGKEKKKKPGICDYISFLRRQQFLS